MNNSENLAPKTDVFQSPDKPNAMWIAGAVFRMNDTDPDYAVMASTPQQLQEAVRKHIDPSQISYFRAGDFQKANITW